MTFIISYDLKLKSISEGSLKTNDFENSRRMISKSDIT